VRRRGRVVPRDELWHLHLDPLVVVDEAGEEHGTDGLEARVMASDPAVDLVNCGLYQRIGRRKVRGQDGKERSSGFRSHSVLPMKQSAPGIMWLQASQGLPVDQPPRVRRAMDDGDAVVPDAA